MTSDLFEAGVGHPTIQTQLLNAYRQKRLPHALLFHGPEGCGKEAFAIALAQLLNAGDESGRIDTASQQYQKIARLQHPDVQFIFPTPAASNVKPDEISEMTREKATNPYRRVVFEGKNTFIGIDTVRELKKEASFRRYEGRKKIFIFSEAEQMRPEAANALLKLLEEPPENLILILITSNIHKILPTIKSRCQMLRFAPLSEPEIVTIIQRFEAGQAKQDLMPLIRLSCGNLKRAFDYLSQDVLPIRDAAIDFLRKAILIHKAQELMKLVETMTAKKNRSQVQLMLWFLLLWFRDILHLSRGAVSEANIINTDKADTLKKFMAYTPNADIMLIIELLEEAQLSLADTRNLNPLLILVELAIRLNPALKPVE